MTHDEPAQDLAAHTQAPATPSQAPGDGILLLDSDMFFVVKVTEQLTHAGYRARKARSEAAFSQALAELDTTPLVAALVNLAARGVDAPAAIARAHAAGVPVIAYCPHVDTTAQAAARAAGATSVISNSKLASDLPGVLARTLRRAGGEHRDPV